MQALWPSGKLQGLSALGAELNLTGSGGSGKPLGSAGHERGSRMASAAGRAGRRTRRLGRKCIFEEGGWEMFRGEKVLNYFGRGIFGEFKECGFADV